MSFGSGVRLAAYCTSKGERMAARVRHVGGIAWRMPIAAQIPHDRHAGSPAISAAVMAPRRTGHPVDRQQKRGECFEHRHDRPRPTPPENAIAVRGRSAALVPPGPTARSAKMGAGCQSGGPGAPVIPVLVCIAAAEIDHESGGSCEQSISPLKSPISTLKSALNAGVPRAEAARIFAFAASR